MESSSSDDIHVLQRLINSKSADIVLSDKSGKSKVWDYYQSIAYKGNINKDKVLCKGCQKIFMYTGKNGTSHLLRHSSQCMKTSRITSSQPTLETYSKRKISHSDKILINKMAIKFVAEDVRPLNIFEGKGFKKFANELIKIGSKYGALEIKDILVSRKTLRDSFLNEEYNALRDSVAKEIAESLNNGIAFTTDFWTDSISQHSYITITAHLINDQYELKNYLVTCELMNDKKTGENVRTAIFEIIKEFFNMTPNEFQNWKNNEQFIFVTDNGANLVSALKNYCRLSCAGHNLNLVIDNWIRSMTFDNPVLELINKCKDLTTFFKKTGLNTKLKISLKQSVPTRWNSVLKMLKSVLLSYSQVEEILIERQEVHKLLDINAELLQSVISVLEPFDEATNDLSYGNEPSVHKILPWFKKIKKHLEKNQEDCKTIKEMKECLMINLKEKYTIKPAHKLASFLDPRMKKFTNLLSDEEKNYIYFEIKRQMQEHIIKNTVEAPAESPTVPNKQTSLHEFFDIPGAAGDTNSEDSEFRNYLEFSSYSLDIEVLKFWKDNQKNFPRLSEIAKMYLAVPATSTPSERIFSISGHTLQKRRSQLSSSAVKKLMFLKYNSGSPM